MAAVRNAVEGMPNAQSFHFVVALDQLLDFLHRLGCIQMVGAVLIISRPIGSRRARLRSLGSLGPARGLLLASGEARQHRPSQKSARGLQKFSFIHVPTAGIKLTSPPIKFPL